MPSKRQWIGLAALAVLILMTIVAMLLRPKRVVVMEVPAAEASADTLSSKPVLRPFDPNTADSLTLVGLGLKPWQVRNLLQYRRKGGRWQKPDDFARLYGLSDSAFQVLRPYIAIDTMPFYREREIRRSLRDSARRADSLFRDSLFRTKDSLWYGQSVAKKDTVLDLNSADTSELQMIRGIGPFVARAIVRRRTELGGFYSPEQLHELAKEDVRLRSLDTLTGCFIATQDSIHPLPVNRCSLRRLAGHPYLNYTQAEAIYNLRHKRLKLKDIHEIRQLSCFTSEDIERLTPYLDFSE